MSSFRADEIPVEPDDADQRLDRWFRRRVADIPHGLLCRLIREGKIRVDGQRADAAQRLSAGQMVRVPSELAQQKGTEPKERGRAQRPADARRLAAMVLFEDDDVVILNKPPGLAVQGGTGLKESVDDMLEALRRKGEDKPRLVHRLDRDTSGLLLIARNALAARRLAEAFHDRAVRKIYWALTCGAPVEPEGVIDLPLRREGPRMVGVGHGDMLAGKAQDAHTIFRVAGRAGDCTAFVTMRPLTGRTHQLRVHLAHLGAPIVGDRFYGQGTWPAGWADKGLNKGLHLHARRLLIPHPRKGMIDARAPLCPALAKSWAAFGFNAEDETEPD